MLLRFHTFFELQLCRPMTDKTATAVLTQDRVHVSQKTHHGSEDWWANQDYLRNLVWKPSVEHLCWETGYGLVRAEERVETAHRTVNRLVFSRTTKTIGTFAVKRSEQIVVHVTGGTKRDGYS